MRGFLLILFLFLFSLVFLPNLAYAQTDCTGGNPPGTCWDQVSGCPPNETVRPSSQCSATNYGTHSFICCVPKAHASGGPQVGLGITCGTGTTLINTAIGCIPFGDMNAMAGFFLRWAIGIGGGIAFLLIVYAGFMILSSSGNPDRLKAGQELLTSAIGGLILLIFSIFILRIIGIDILKLPGL